MSREFKSPVTKNLWEYAVVTVSTLIMVFGNYFFKFPNNFAFGGITGFSTIVSALTKLSASQFTFIANMVLLVMGFIFIGKGFGMKTVYSSVLMSLALGAMDRWFPMGKPLTDQPILELVFAVFLPAVGSALLFNIGASSGGTDIIAAIINKYRDITLGRVMLICDLIIISSSYFVLKDWEKVVYGYVTLYICSFVLDQVVNSARQSVQFFIISEKYEEIAKHINVYPHRGATVINASGFYTGKEIKMLFVLAKKRESTIIFRLIKDIDPNAFVSQSQVIGVYGEGFDKIKVK